ncbi:MAG TPA: FAD-binding oxidoreductase [Thermomonospora sp.]|nr:FAD-binding oxidoreductase [Thermomonospora sp.]
MTDHARRALLGGAAVTLAAGASGLAGGRAAQAAEPGCPQPAGPVTVGRDDPRYRSLVGRGYNRRFEGRPDHVRVVGSTRDVMRAVEDAVRAGKKIAVRSGGHCFEDFVDGPSVQVIIDLSGMTGVSFDRERNAFAVEAGATLGDVYRRLYTHWGVTIPAGTNPLVGVGGHVQGAGYGTLCRLHGLTVDHLYAVEVVVVDRTGRARVVVATREPSDPDHDLWWAHTGGGGGNFGVVTRYWFRSPGARGSDPSGLLPRPPSTVLQFTLDWSWEDLDRGDDPDFLRLLRNYGTWAERNAGAGTPNAALYSEFALSSRPLPNVTMAGQVSLDSGAHRPLDDLLSALHQDIGARPGRTVTTMPWLTAMTHGLADEPGPVYRVKIKSGLPRRGFTDRQIAAIHRHLTRTDVPHVGGLLSVNTFGGKVNTVAPEATAMPHRDSVLILAYVVGWQDASQDASQLAWIRELYADVYRDTGGVPASDGAFVNYPDSDLADPRHNTSRTPWHALYYKGSYTRLQRIKARWDPRNVFTHGLGIKPR